LRPRVTSRGRHYPPGLVRQDPELGAGPRDGPAQGHHRARIQASSPARTPDSADRTRTSTGCSARACPRGTDPYADTRPGLRPSPTSSTTGPERLGLATSTKPLAELLKENIERVATPLESGHRAVPRRAGSAVRVVPRSRAPSRPAPRRPARSEDTRGRRRYAIREPHDRGCTRTLTGPADR
jgi:hypothetical protein